MKTFTAILAAFAVTALGLGLLFTGNAAAQGGYPVADTGNTTQNKELTKEAVNQVDRLNEVINQQKITNESIGQARNDSLTNLFDGYSKDAQLLEDLNPGSQFKLIAKQLPSAYQNPTLKFDSVKNSRNVIEETLYNDAVQDVTNTSKFRNARRKANQEAALTGYALAIHNRQKLSEQKFRAQTLVDEIKNADNLMNEVAANTAVLMALYEQQAQMQALLASLTEMQATSLLSNDPGITVNPNSASTPGN